MTKNVLSFIRLAALAGFLSCCGIYLSAQQSKQAVQQKTVVAMMSPDDCTGCLNGSDGSCLACHNFTYAAGGCQTCYGGSGMPPIMQKRESQKWVWVPGVTTGKQMEVIDNWRKIGMPVHHLERAIKARATVSDCKGKKTITE